MVDSKVAWHMDASATDVGGSRDAGGSCHQYCLKWNNHKNNISGIFEKLRFEERFVDVTLVSSDHKTIECHRLILSAGSGYLKDILLQNPSDHPTIVLSTINYAELRQLVDFMYAGEVAVDQDYLDVLLEAAKVLKIKGLWESSHGELPKAKCQNLASLMTVTSQEATVATSRRKKRKRCSRHLSKLDNDRSLPRDSNHHNSDDDFGEGKTCGSADEATPRSGISNTYFLTQQPAAAAKPTPQVISDPPLKSVMPDKAVSTVQEDSDSKSDSCSPVLADKVLKEIPALMSQAPIHSALMSAIGGWLPFLPSSPSNETAHRCHKKVKSTKGTSVPSALLPGTQLIGSVPVRRYKQYTEESLQQALNEITEGQSINRSSLKFNIPARTLRDWMKRLNITSVYTHHSQIKDGRSSSLDSNMDDSCGEAPVCKVDDPEPVWCKTPPSLHSGKGHCIVFPGMLTPAPKHNGDDEDRDRAEEELDDDETLKVCTDTEN